MIKKFILAALTPLLFLGCSSLKVTMNYDSTFDFTNFKSYSFYGWHQESSKIPPHVRQNIQLAFADEFGKRGMMYDATDSGDVVISLFIAVDKETSRTYYNNYYAGGPYGYAQPGWGWGVGYGYGYPGYGPGTYEETDYYTGTLVCDVFDRRTKRLAWQGVVSKAINTTNAKQQAKNIPMVVGRLMKTYPVQPAAETTTKK